MNETRKWLRSFRYAYEGLQYVLRTQRNMKFHFCISAVVLILALFLQVSKWEALFLMLAITLVLVAEMINTAIEKTVDLVTRDVHPLAKIAKDVAAAAVLVTAVFAACVGLVIFYHPVEMLIAKTGEAVEPESVQKIWILLCLVALVLIVLQSRFSAARGGGSSARPSLIAGIAAAVSTLMALFSGKIIVVLLSLALTFMICLVLYEKSERSGLSLAAGVFAGSLVTVLAYYSVHHL